MWETLVIVSSPNTCIGGGLRLWFPNAGGWFAFYDANGLAQDAVSWANQSNLAFGPCVAPVSGCSFNGVLPDYNNIPANRKNMISTQPAGNHLNQTLRRIPDGGPWAISQAAAPTYGTCNAACVPAPVITCTGTATINVTGSTPPYTYIWNDSKMQTTQTADSLCAGNYIVLVKDAFNNFASFNVTVSDHKPLVTASIDTIICFGDSAFLNVTGFVTTTFDWNQGLGAGPSHIVHPATSTQYIVTATDTAACTNKDTVNVAVNLVPVNLNSNSPVCFDENLLLSETSAPAHNYTWTGPNNFSSTAQANNLNNITLAAEGRYFLTVELNGCQSKDSIDVIVNPLPAIAASNDGPVCSGQQLTLSVTGDPGTNYQWNGPGAFASSQQNPVIPSLNHADSGFYYVTVTDVNGCFSTDSTYVFLNPDPNPDFIFINKCFGESVPFTNTSSILTGSIDAYSWNFGLAGANSSLQDPTFTYASDGFYQVELTATSDSGCVVSLNQQVQAYAFPIPDFSFTAACLNSITNFSSLSTLANGNGTMDSWVWDFGDGTSNVTGQNPAHTYNTSGSFITQIKVTSSFGCSDSIQLPVEVFHLPEPDYSFVSACEGTPLNFSNLSTMPSPGSISDYDWSFGDNNSGSGLNPNHTYLNGGSFDVKLIATSSDGCIDSITKAVFVYHNPVSDFTFSDICTYETAVFINASTVDLSSNITGYSWEFGDGSPVSSDVNAPHSYSPAGQYVVTLTSTTNEGCTNDAIKTINVFEPPQAAFLVSDVCTNQLANFINNTIDPSTGSIAQYQWDFGNGTGNLQNPPGHSYLPGIYNISLVALIQYSPNLSCSDTANGSVEIFPLPIPDFSFTDVCHGILTEFTDLSLPAADIVAWDWDFDNLAAGSAVQHPNHLYNGLGTFNASLKVTSNDGCEATIVKPVIVYGIPVAAFTAPDVCLGATSIFTDASTVALPSVINQWEWEVTDLSSNAFFNTKNAQYLFATVGSYDVKLKVVTDHSCADSITQIVHVNPNPVVDFSASINAGCSPLCVDFTENASILAPGLINFYLWDYGDGGSSTSKTPGTYCYLNNTVVNVNAYP
ncbi:MAG: PKD domain-containing protein, partial [Bacteroidetes bacterium]|nr:PKD domain-containing protein [Bacteroidota bacterium]